MEGTELDLWARRATDYGLLMHERQAVLAAAGMLSGALAACVDMLERPTEAAVLAVFDEVCRRAAGPAEAPIRAGPG